MEMMEVGLEDDVFFADLNKQISLLIMEDDDDYNPVPVVNSPSVSLQNSSQYHPPQHPMMPSQILYQPQPQQPPQQISSCRRETKGTGVFIPLLLSQPRRNRSKQGRNASSSYNHKSNYSKQIVSARMLSPRHDHRHHRYHHHQEPAYTPTTTLNGSNQIRYY